LEELRILGDSPILRWDGRTPTREASMRREEMKPRQQALLGTAILLVVIPSLLFGAAAASLLLRFRTPSA